MTNKNLKICESFNRAFKSTSQENLKDIALKVVNGATVFKSKARKDDGYQYVYGAVTDGTKIVASLCINYYPETQEENSS